MNTDLDLDQLPDGADVLTLEESELMRLDELLDERLRERSQPWREVAEEIAAGRNAGKALSTRQREHLDERASLFASLDDEKVTLPEGFADAVLERARQEHRSAAGWRSFAAAAAAVLFLLTASVLLFGRTADGVVGTLADVAWSAVTVGAGLLDATWKGAGTLVGSWFEESPLTLFGALFALLGAQLFAWSRLRRRAHSEVAASTESQR